MDSLLGVLKKTGFQPDDPSNAAHVLMLAWAWSHGTSRAEVLDNWYSGTQHQFSHVVPKGQTWLIGEESKNSGSDAVMLVKRGHPSPVPVAKAAGLLLGGDWLPWKKNSLHPAWWQSVFVIDNRRVWASLCVEQVQPWTWLEAMAQRPNLILAMTNDWWAKSMTAPGIQMANTRSWARLISGRMSEIGEQETLAIINQNELRAFRTIGVYDMHKFDEEPNPSF